MRAYELLFILTLSPLMFSCGSKKEILHEKIQSTAKYQQSDTFQLQQAVSELQVAVEDMNCMIDSPVIVLNCPDSSVVIVKGKRMSLSRKNEIGYQLIDSLVMSGVNHVEEETQAIMKVDSKVIRKENPVRVAIMLVVILWIIWLGKRFVGSGRG